VVAGERGGHDDDEIAAAFEKPRQGRDAVELGISTSSTTTSGRMIEALERLAAVRSAATSLSPGALLDQRDNRLRTTAASSTTITRISSGPKRSACRGRLGQCTHRNAFSRLTQPN
jgi:hypothetical protein